MKNVRITWDGTKFVYKDLDGKGNIVKNIDEQVEQILSSNEDVEVKLADKYHDIRRDILMTMEVLFDKVDDDYVKNDYTEELLISAIKELEYVNGLLRIIKTRL